MARGQLTAEIWMGFIRDGIRTTQKRQEIDWYRAAKGESPLGVNGTGMCRKSESRGKTHK